MAPPKTSSRGKGRIGFQTIVKCPEKHRIESQAGQTLQVQEAGLDRLDEVRQLPPSCRPAAPAMGGLQELGVLFPHLQSDTTVVNTGCCCSTPWQAQRDDAIWVGMVLIPREGLRQHHPLFISSLKSFSGTIAVAHGFHSVRSQMVEQCACNAMSV